MQVYNFSGADTGSDHDLVMITKEGEKAYIGMAAILVMWPGWNM